NRYGNLSPLVSPQQQPATGLNGHLSELSLPPAAVTSTSSTVASSAAAAGHHSGPIVYTHENAHLKVWFPLLTGRSKLISDNRFEVRSKALDVLFEVLKHHGTKFQPELWRLIFKGVLFPIFDPVHHGAGNGKFKEDDHWLKTTCLSALKALIDLFSYY